MPECGLDDGLKIAWAKAARYRELANKYEEISYALRNFFDDSPEGHAGFYAKACSIIFTETGLTTKSAQAEHDEHCGCGCQLS